MGGGDTFVLPSPSDASINFFYDLNLNSQVLY